MKVLVIMIGVMQEDFQLYLTTSKFIANIITLLKSYGHCFDIILVFGPLVDTLGDSKVQAREAAQALLQSHYEDRCG